MIMDLRYALRTMARQPLFTAMATLSLALGIGANTAIFSFMDAILIRSLPVKNPESLVVLNWHSKDAPAVVRGMSGNSFRDPHVGFTSGSFPYSAYELLRINSPAFSTVFAFFGTAHVSLLIHGEADLANGQYVSGEYFGGLGAPPAAGRLIDDSDDRAGAHPVAVLGYQYARRHFNDVSKAVGQSLQIKNVAYTVAGVTGPEFFGVDPAGPPDVYLPLHTSGIFLAPSANGNPLYLDNNFYWVRMMARLKPDITREQAEQAVARSFQHLVQATAVNDKERADLPVLYLQEGAGGLDFLRRQYSKPLFVLMGMAGLILLIACANIANLLLARAAVRRREMALRLSLGASRIRVLRQLLTESVLLASLGGLGGLVVAKWGIDALTLLIASGRANFALHAELNWRVLAAAMGLSLVTGIVFGLAPAIQSLGVDLNSAIKQARAGRPQWRITPSRALVVLQISISLLLLAAAGLFVRTLTNLNSIALGFNADHVLLVTVNAGQSGYENEALVQFYEDLQARLQAIPGVRGVTSSSTVLVSGSENRTKVRIPSLTGKSLFSSFLNVGPAFFTTMQIPILRGREIDERDVRRGAAVTVVNEAFVKTYFPGQDPIGQCFGFGAGSRLPDVEIVGVAKNARYSSLKGDIPPVTYLPYSLNVHLGYQMNYELRAAGDPNLLAQSVRQVVHQADARIPVINIATQSDRVDQTISQERTFATLCGCFAVLALVIACVGLYGTMAYNVVRRTNEIGIRMALGAQRRRVIWMVLREVLAMAAAGLGVGLAVAVATSHILQSFVFQVKPNDPAMLGMAALILLAATLLAGYGPAVRASRVDPWTALRDE